MRQSSMRRVFAIVGLTGALSACENSRGEIGSPSESLPPAVETGSGATQGPAELVKLKSPAKRHTPGGGVSVPVIRQRSVFEGTTSVDTSPRICFGANGILPETAEATLQSLARRASFVDATGRTIQAKVELEDIVDPHETWSHHVWFSPAEALKSDAWYWLTITHDASLPVWDAVNKDGKPAEPTQFSSRFFTGSAPRIIRVIRDTRGSHYQVFLSEPIQVGSAVGQVALKNGAAPLSGCIWSMNACVTRESPLMNSGFDFRLNSPSNGRATALQFGGAIKGSGRTVSESVSATRDLALQGAVAEIPLSASDWKPCDEANGGAECWSARPVLPPL